jgi:uncharacterized membrane protein
MVMQKIAADRMPRLELTLRQGTVYRAFLRSPLWLGGFAIMTAGWGFFLKAVANAPVSIVQPVLGFGLVVLALFSVMFLRERLRAAEWSGVALMVAGIVLLGISGSGEQRATTGASWPALLVVSGILLAVLASVVPLGRSGRLVPLPVILGFGAGVLIGLGALYTKALFLGLEAGAGAFVWLVFLPLTVVANVAGIWVQQAGFQQGRALIVVAVNAVTNKLVTILGGTAILGEQLPNEPILANARIAGFVTILVGTMVLARFGGEQVAEEIEAGEPIHARVEPNEVGPSAS